MHVKSFADDFFLSSQEGHTTVPIHRQRLLMTHRTRTAGELK
jgi:hypothetical protein